MGFFFLYSVPSPLALRKDIAGDRISVSSTASTSSLPDVQSPKQISEGKLFQQYMKRIR